MVTLDKIVFDNDEIDNIISYIVEGFSEDEFKEYLSDDKYEKKLREWLSKVEINLTINKEK